MSKKYKVKNRWLVLVLFFLGGLLLQGEKVSANVEEVSTPAEFSAAWNNSNTTKIVLKNDILYGSGTTGLKNRTTNIEITGEAGASDYGYRLNLQSRSLRVDNPTESTGKGLFKLHDIIVENNGAITGARGGFVEDDSYTGSSARNWTFEIGNLQVPKGRTVRLGRVTRGQVNVYGKLNLSTLGENFYTGGMYFEEGTEYYGEITRENFSAIWFRSSIKAGDSGDGKFELAPNTSVKLRNTGTGVTYPAVYRAYKEIIIGENAEFTATVPGSAVQFGGTNKKFTAKKGSVVTLTSLNSQSSILARSTTGGDSGISQEDNPANPTNAQMIFEPGSSLFVIGKSGTSGMIDWTNGTNNTLRIDTPKQFDIRNNNNNRALNVSGSNRIELLTSNVDMWKNASNVTGSADFSHNMVASFGVNANNLAQSSTQLLEKEYNSVNGQVRRIMGLNTEPTFLWQEQVTDADKNLTKVARVRLGMVPDNTGLDENGNLAFMPMYATKDQVEVIVNDSLESFPEQKLKTEEGGYISYQLPDFYVVATKLFGQAFRSGLAGEVAESRPVVDITPPAPAKITISTITTSTKELVGQGAEPFATVYIHVNNQKQPGNIKVDQGGNWRYQLPEYFKAGELITIYLEDNAGKAPTDLNPAAPTTNNDLGNLNPLKELSYREAVFPAAPSFKVKDDIVSQPQITKTVKSNTLDSQQKEITQVGSILTYKITLKNNDPRDSDKVLRDSLFEDQLPSGLVFEQTSLTATKNGTTIPAEDFLFSAGKLSYLIGELHPQDEVIIEFSTVVTREAVDEIITNRAKISGQTSQEKLLKNEAAVNNPGGTVAGQLVLESAPTVVDFGKVSITDFQKQVGVDKTNIATPLLVEDTRKSRSDWEITAQIEKEMTNGEDVQVGALKYIYKKERQTLDGTPKIIYTNNGTSAEYLYNVSDSWQKGALAEGLKLQLEADHVPKTTGSYEGVIRWTLRDTIE